MVSPVNPIPVAPKFSTKQSVTQMELALQAFNLAERKLEAQFDGNTPVDIKATNYFKQQAELAAETMARVLQEKFPFMRAFSIEEIVTLIKGPGVLQAQLNALAAKVQTQQRRVNRFTRQLKSLTSQINAKAADKAQLEESLGNLAATKAQLQDQIDTLQNTTIPADEANLSNVAKGALSNAVQMIADISHEISVLDGNERQAVTNPVIAQDIALSNAYKAFSNDLTPSSSPGPFQKLIGDVNAIPAGTAPTADQLQIIANDVAALNQPLQNLKNTVNAGTFTQVFKDAFNAITDTYTADVPGFNTGISTFNTANGPTGQLAVDKAKLLSLQKQLAQLSTPATIQQQIALDEQAIAALIPKRNAIRSQLNVSKKAFSQFQTQLNNFLNDAGNLESAFAFIGSNDPFAAKIILQLRGII